MNTRQQNVPSFAQTVQSRSTYSIKVFPSPCVRRVLFWGLAIILTLGAVIIMGDLFWRSGLHRAHLLLLFIYTALIGLLSIGFTHALFGFVLLLRSKAKGITASQINPADTSALEKRYALVIPVYNENPVAVAARIEAMYRSIEQTSMLESFDFYILSDTTSLECWIEEEVIWVNLCQKLNAFGRLYYRRRATNENRKAGNISDFVRKWGGHYDAMLVLDADSLMEGKDIVKMARVMEACPRLGILQTAPRLIRAKSIFSRMQQFAMSLYGPLFVRGLSFWQLGSGSYWGHNAMIRIKPFSQYCELPALPGREPFGGRILSHDFVEASLMVREGWEVWLAWDIEGTYEESPPSMLDHLKRDRRWSQGNFQHTWLLFARKLSAVVRAHLFMGIMAYLASPLLTLFILLSLWVSWDWEISGLSPLNTKGLGDSLLGWSFVQQTIILSAWTLTLLFSPKLLAWLQVMLNQKKRNAFGGGMRLTLGVAWESLSALAAAPVIMVYHTFMVFGLVLGITVNWLPQKRESTGTSWSEAWLAHGLGVLIGIVGLLFLLSQGAEINFWLIPLFIGLIVSVPLSVVTSRENGGKWLKTMKIGSSPEELNPPKVVQLADQALLEQPSFFPRQTEKFSFLLEVVVDPYVNAIHLSLLDSSDKEPDSLLVEKWLEGGSSVLTTEELKRILYHHASLLAMHRSVWLRPFSQLHLDWVNMIASYGSHVAPLRYTCPLPDTLKRSLG